MRTSRCPGMVFALVTLLSAATVVSQDRLVVDWIRERAIRLTTAQAGHGFADMQSLKALIGDARVVALGEATHGSREFFQLKHRMVEFLAAEMGFTIVAIEANMPESDRLNDYVLHGTGDPAALLHGLGFWTWDTEEALAMVQWMREFNRSGKGQIELTGFDMQMPAAAMDIVGRFVAQHDADYVGMLHEVSSLVPTAGASPPGGAFAVASATFPVAQAAGKTIRYSGYIKTRAVSRGWAGLWWRVDGASGVLALDNMEDRGATGTTGWRRYVLELPVAANAKNAAFGVLMPGTGTAWFDDLAITVDGRPFADPARFDFGFESSTLKGFSPAGNGYSVQLDSEVAHSGTQSLRLRYESDAPAPLRVAARWKEVVDHLEAGKADFRARGASDREIEWAIQNARLVLQRVQVHANSNSRDRSMADNVRWIADRHPRAKMVLWAHNAHVATGSFGDDVMGRHLRRMFGERLLVFGFAFGDGSFQSTSMKTHALESFTVPRAPEGSLDAALAASNIPVFALDLRQSPAWFQEPRPSRQIGAAYPEDSPDASFGSIVATDAFDVMLFVDHTSAARMNPTR